MVKNISLELNLLHQRRRMAIQFYVKEHFEAKLNKVAKLFHVSPICKYKMKIIIILLKHKEIEKQN